MTQEEQQEEQQDDITETPRANFRRTLTLADVRARRDAAEENERK